MRRYWVHFRIILDEGRAATAEMEVTRDLPICVVADLQDIGNAIGAALMKEDKFPPGALGVQVISWIKFEEASIILAGPPH